MFLRDIIHRRFEALLRPWLRDEPELELELGLINSRVTAKNLRLDVSSLNRLLGDSSGFCFREFGVEHFSVGFSNWSVPAFKIEVRGVKVTLLAGEVDEDGSLRRARRPSKSVSDEKKKVLAEIDPEGSALHDVLERILVSATSRNRFKTSLLNLIFEHCHLQIFDTILRMQVPTSNDVLIYFLQVKEVNAESKYFGRGCLLRGLVGAAFKPLKETSIALDFTGCEIGYGMNDRENFIVRSTDLFTCIKLTDLQIAGLSIRVPELSLSISPVELPVLLVLGKLSSKESKHIRSGRQLWRLAADRLGYAISSPRLSLHSLVELVCVWMRYLNAYENLLLVFGHFADSRLEDSSINISQDTMLLTSVKNNWEVICRTEKMLPAEAIAQARRIARYRAALDVQNGEDGNKQFSVNSQFKVLSKMLLMVVFTWGVICRMFLSMMNFFIWLIKIFFQGQNPFECSGVDCPQYCFLLNFGRIIIKLSPKHTIQNVNEDMEPHNGTSYSNAHSVSLSIDALLLVYSDEIFKRSLSISCGMLKVKSSSVIGATIMQRSFKSRIGTVKGHREGRIDNIDTILHSEPADMFLPSQTTKTSATDQAELAHNPLLKKFLGETWLNWKEDLTKYDGAEYEISEYPWVLIEIKSCLTYPGRKNLDSGLWKCCLSVGKLNLTLAYPSMLSIAALTGQIQQAMNWTEEHGTQIALSNSRPPTENQLESSWEGMYEFYARKLKMAVFKMLPEKRIQLGIFIIGPHIQLSLQKDDFNYGNDDMSDDVSHLGFNIHNIEVFIWPSAKCNLALTEWSGFDDAEPECLLREPQIIEIPKSDNEKFASPECISLRSFLRISGLNIYMRDWAEKQHNQIFVLKPIAVRLVLTRESVHSFSTNIIALSSALCGMAMGFTFTISMDELYVLYQVVADLFSELSYASGSLDVVGYVPVRDLLVFTEPENDESTTEGAQLIQNSTLISINGIFRFKSMDIILHNSQMSDKLEIPIKVYGAFGSQKFAGHDLPDCGIWISVHQTCVETYCEEEKLEVLLNLLGIQSVLFRHQNHIGKSFCHLTIEDLRQKCHNWLYEISLSSCTFTLWLRGCCNSSDKPFDNSPSSSSTVKNSHQITESKLSNSTFFQKMGLSLPASHWVLISATLSGIYMARCSAKNILVGAHQSNELTSFLSVEGNLQKICWKMQGGLLLLETIALVTFARCFAAYLDCIADRLSNVRSSDKSFENAECKAQEIQRRKWKLPKASDIDVSRFSFVLVIEDESGYFQELVLEVDVHAKLESASMLKKFRIDLSRISIFIQVLQEYVESENQIPHFSSLVPSESSSRPFLGNSDAEIERTNGAHISHQNYIMKHLVASLSVEKPKNSPLPWNQVWVGSGSILGFDMTISLSELKMISSIASSFSTVYEKKATIDPKQRYQSSDEVTDRSFEDMVPNGAVVAVKDIHQHMYFGVEGGENKYNVVGAIHYSLLREKALFRVEHHKQRIWKSSVLWFSLMSLHAKDESGEPLRLNYRPGSAFVDISSNNDSGRSLWTALSCETENYKGDIDWEPCNKLVKGAFYLVNKKNDSGVAFVDGIPEFVKKPGNPFKFKVFHDFAVAHGFAILDGRSLKPSWENVGPTEKMDKDQNSKNSGLFPCIQIGVDNIGLTVIHELPDSKDRFPLLHGCISNTQLDVQVLPYKARVMGKSTVSLNYFEAQRNLWRELLRPVDVCAFYRKTLETRVSKTPQHMVPIHIYCRTKELDISLTELSLDILLFVVGKLNLAGPFSVRNSMIFANCCQVENLSSLNLICEFFDKKGVTIAGKQAASVFLRHPVLANQQPEGASTVTIQLSNLGPLATSSLHLSLIKPKAFAWRTRIISLQDSRTYPGPFIVVDISRKTEDGLSLVISPLLKIHNETEFSMELRFRRPQQNEDEFASVLLKKGDSIDDSMATFDAINMAGGLKKALMSLSVGNFYFSFRPEITDGLIDSPSTVSVAWSDELKGGKAVRLSGIFDKLSYQVRKALSVELVKFSFDTAYCRVKSEDKDVTNLHFLIQTASRNVAISEPDKSYNGSENRNSAVALQEQREIFLLPTVHVSNLLHSEICVLLTETDKCITLDGGIIGKQATIPCGSTVDFYANPASIYITVTLTAWKASCKTVNIGDWVKKLLKNKNNVKCLEVDLDFGGGKYFSSLRLSRGLRGVLEAAILTPYSLKNDTDFYLYFFSSNEKPLTRDEIEKFGSSIPPELGLFSPPSSVRSWFLKSHKMRFKILKYHASEALLNLDALSGLTEVSLEIKEPGSNYVMKFGVSVGPSAGQAESLSQTVTMVPRHVVFNESGQRIIVRQCYLEDETAGIICINGKQRAPLQLQSGIGRSRELSLFENIIRKHRNDTGNSQIYIQFRPNDSELSWSGPVCIASLGRFFLKFRRQESQVQELDNNATEFASVHVVEEGSTLCVHFHKPSNINLPYRIENHLRDTSVTFYQKDSSEQEFLRSGGSTHYVWDDLTLPHKLVVLISDMHLLREINLDKVRAWKPFLKPKHQRGLASRSLVDRKPGDKQTYINYLNSMEEIANVGYEVYAEGLTRVLRICGPSDSHEEDIFSHTHAKIQLKLFHFAIHLLEHGKQDSDGDGEATYTPVIAARLANVSLDSVFTNQQKYSQLNVQFLSIDEKWAGAPFAAMLRRHQLDLSESNAPTIKIVFVLLATSSNVRQVKHSSIVLQPIDVNIDEETLMKVASFWRTSLSDSSAPSQQYYFDHFEVHPIKIVSNFLPGDSYSSYNSTQETLRTLLHSVIKVPPIKNMVVELNGILVTHALITMRELLIRCAQHYSWYAMRAIYIAKGSPLLPPAFASIFDDLASSSLDVFFDPSRGLVNLPGFTLGTLKFISKSINGKGFSGTKRYFGDLGKTLKVAGSNVLFAAVTEISDSVLKGAETSGFDGMVSGFHQGILKLAMEPSLLGTALMEGGPDRKVKLDRSPGIDELYIEGYLQAMLDTMYRQEYLRVRVIDDQVLLKNLPPNSVLIDEILDRVKGFLVSKGLLTGDPSMSSRSLRHLKGESDWKIGPTLMTLCEHLLVSYAIRMLRKHTSKLVGNINRRRKPDGEERKAMIPAERTEQEQRVKFRWKWGISKFVLSGILAYVDGRLCRYIPNPVARRIVSGYLLSFIDKRDGE